MQLSISRPPSTGTIRYFGFTKIWWCCSGINQVHEGGFENAQVHFEHVKSHAVNGAYCLGRGTKSQADVWCKQNKFGGARSEILRAPDIYKRLMCGGLYEALGRIIYKRKRAPQPLLFD